MDSSRRAVESYWRSRVIDGATSDEDNVTPVYKLEEICELLRSSHSSIVKEVSGFILRRLDHKSPILKQKLSEELTKVDEKLKLIESLLESKIKKINDENKASMAAQFAAEATLRRVHAAQKDDDMPPIEAILAPLEAELKLARQERFCMFRWFCMAGFIYMQSFFL